MSSEGSVTSSESRIRQFGLYRTIDARTEDFLRSSRKRQIRQGCACAAISTAITVTVVVSVILVYEYSINAESNINKKMSIKPNWFGLMNESDIASLDSKFNKKINFDKTTLKLLPILLKALNKNRYLEKIIDDYSSSSPPYLGKDSSEATFKRNVFSDTKNWLKMPTSKLYTIDYKTSPLIYWKSPTQRLEYLTKIRKIRDYQRMLNYFDKMVNDKVGSNQRKEFEFTERPYIAETAPMKIERVKQMIPKKYPIETYKNAKEFTSNNDNVKESAVSCKCPKKLGQLLTKLIAGIQDMVPHMISNKISGHKCGNDSKSTDLDSQLTTTARTVTRTKPITIQLHSTNQMHTKPFGRFFKSYHKFATKATTFPRRNILTRKRIITNIPSNIRRYTTPRTSTSTTASSTTTTIASTTASTTKSTSRTTTFRKTPRSAARTSARTTHRTYAKTTASTTTAVPLTTTTEDSYLYNNKFEDTTVKPTLNIFTTIYEKNTLDYDSLFKVTDASHPEITSNVPVRPTTTEPFVPIKFIDNSKERVATEKYFDAYTVDPLYSHPTLPVFREEDYDEYFGATTKLTNEFENLDVHSLELVKTKMMSSPNNNEEIKSQNNVNKMKIKSKPLNYHPVVKQKDLDLLTMRKMADMIYVPEERPIIEDLKPKSGPKMSLQSYKNQIAPRLRAKITNSVESNTSITGNKFSSSVKNSIKISSAEPDLKNEPLDTKNAIEQQANSDNIGEEDFQDEFAIKNVDSSTSIPYRNENATRKISIHEIEKEDTQNSWDIKREDKGSVRSPESMLPSMRPIYLEIQRNSDWRQDDHANDYDNNFNNNFFDLPNN